MSIRSYQKWILKPISVVLEDKSKSKSIGNCAVIFLILSSTKLRDVGELTFESLAGLAES